MDNPRKPPTKDKPQTRHQGLALDHQDKHNNLVSMKLQGPSNLRIVTFVKDASL